jgi:hypothetical protein
MNKEHHKYNQYSAWRNARIRKEVGARTDVKLFWKSYRVWEELTRQSQPHLTQQDIISFLTSEFGAPYGGRTFIGTIVCDTAEEFQEYEDTQNFWDKESEARSSILIPTEEERVFKKETKIEELQDIQTKKISVLEEMLTLKNNTIKSMKIQQETDAKIIEILRSALGERQGH